ncbi:hypothetical protein ANCDUO_25480, partial [Ancylostoma duodenale]
LTYREAIRNGHEVRIELNTPYDRIRNTISNVAWPMSQAGISTVICILPIVVLQNYIPLVFVKTITLVVIWGLWHGMLINRFRVDISYYEKMLIPKCKQYKANITSIIVLWDKN